MRIAPTILFAFLKYPGVQQHRPCDADQGGEQSEGSERPGQEIQPGMIAQVAMGKRGQRRSGIRDPREPRRNALNDRKSRVVAHGGNEISLLPDHTGDRQSDEENRKRDPQKGDPPPRGAPTDFWGVVDH